MKIKNNALTIIVGGGIITKEKEYVDGEIIPIKNKLGLRHLEKLKEAANILMIEESSNNEVEMMKIIAKHGHVIIYNYGVNCIKQSAMVMLPRQMTYKQIIICEKLKEEFVQDYEIISSSAIPIESLPYKGDLKLMEYEDKIKGISQSDVDSLYSEIALHKQRLNEMDVEHEQIKGK